MLPIPVWNEKSEFKLKSKSDFKLKSKFKSKSESQVQSFVQYSPSASHRLEINQFGDKFNRIKAPETIENKFMSRS